jgi:uncharacterized protein (TIGR02118 family)
MADNTSGQRHIRCLVMLKKRNEMTQAEFDKYWLDIHGKIAQHYPNVVRYSQLHLTQPAPAQEFDDAPDIEISGIVDFVYTSVDDVPNIWESPAGTEGRKDAPKFLAGALHCFVEETVITDHLGIGALTERPLVTSPLRYP